MDWIFNTEIWVALFTLATLEIVLGVDNLVFISIAVSRLDVLSMPLTVSTSVSGGSSSK